MKFKFTLPNILEKYSFKIIETSESMLKFTVTNNANVGSGLAVNFEDSYIFILYLEIKNFAPETKRKKIAEYLSIANYGILNGNFEINPGNGAIRHKYGFCYEGTNLDMKLIENAVKTSLENIDIYGEEIISMMK